MELVTGIFGNATLVVLIILGLAWILVPIWVWSIRDSMKKHLEQQEKLLRTVESLLHETRQQASRPRP